MVEIKSVIDLDEIEIDLHFLFKHSASRRENYKLEKEITEITAHFMKKHVESRWLSIYPWFVRIFGQMPNLCVWSNCRKRKVSIKRMTVLTMNGNRRFAKCCKIRKQAEVCMSFDFCLSRRFMVSLQAAVPMVHWFCQMCLDIWHVLGIVVKEDILLNNKGKRMSNKKLKEIDLTVVQEPATEVFTPVLTKGLSTKKHCSQYADPKKVLSDESLCRPLVPSPQPKCPKRTFMLPQKYHVSV